MAEKYVKGIACAEEKSRQVIRKYEKRQPLSDLEQQYNFKQIRPTLSIPIDSDNCGPRGTSTFDLVSNHGLTSDETKSSPSFRSQRRSLSQSPAVRKKLHTWVKQSVMDSTLASRPKSGDRSGTRYEIETSIGKVVAEKLARGGGVGGGSGSLGIWVGKNGQAVKPEAEVAASATTLSLSDAENSRSHLQTLASLLMASQPLSLEDAAKTCRVIMTQRSQPVAEPVVSSETRPVVFNTAAESRPYVPFSIRADSEAFKQQLTQLKAVQLQDPASAVMCLCKPNDVSPVSKDVTYEELLSIRAPATSAMSGAERFQSLPVDPSPAPPDNPPATAATGRFSKDSPTAPASPAPGASSSTSSLLRDEFRRSMKRQVTMPSYTVVRGVDVHGQRQRPGDGGGGRSVKRGTAAAQQRGKSALRSPLPPHSTVAFHKAFGPTTPTITPNGVPGRKQYVAITTDLWAYGLPPHDSHVGQATLDEHRRTAVRPTVAWASTSSGRQAPHAHMSGNNSSSEERSLSAAAAGATPGGSDMAAAAQSSLASSPLAGRSAASSGRRSWHAATAQDSSRDSRSALSSNRLHAASSRLPSATAAAFDDQRSDVGTPTWRQVSIPTAGAPSEASEDDDSGGSGGGSLDGRLASATAVAAASSRQRAVSQASKYDGQAMGPSAAAAAAEGEAAASSRQSSAWRGGAEELQAMRSFIQEDLARTKIETQRMIQNAGHAKRQRSTSGHVLAQEWLS